MVAHVIIVSAPLQGIWISGFLTWSELGVRIWVLLGQGIEDLDLDSDLTNIEQFSLYGAVMVWGAI